MSAQRVFIILFLLLISSIIYWYIFLYYPLTLDLEKAQHELKRLNSQIRNAKRAEKDLQIIEQKLREAENNLRMTKSRFVTQKDLSYVTKVLRKKAQDFDLKIADFIPVLDDYFEDKNNNHINSLPIIIKLRGRYLNIGKFIEKWPDLDFYLIAREISIEKEDSNSNELIATITADLFIYKDEGSS